MVYFQTILEVPGSKLNELESVTLCQSVLQSGKVQMVETFIQKDQVTLSTLSVTS